MHIEKSIFANILGTLRNIQDKIKNNTNSCRDLAELHIRKEIHLSKDSDQVTISHAYFMLHGDEQKEFCAWLTNVTFF